MLLILICLYIGFGIGYTLWDDEYWGFEDFAFSVISWPLTIFEPLVDLLFEGFEWLVDRFDDLADAVWNQIEDLFGWVADNTIGRFDGTQTQRSGDNSINIQSRDNIDMREDFDSWVSNHSDVDIQIKGRVLRAKKKEPSEVDLLKQNILD